MMKIDEEIFWYSNISFIKSVLYNKQAYDNWWNYVRNKELKKDR